VPLLFGIEIAVAQYNVATGGISGIFSAPRHLRKERIADIAQDQAQDLRTARDETAGQPIRPVVEAGCGLQHALAGEPMYPVIAVQRA